MVLQDVRKRLLLAFLPRRFARQRDKCEIRVMHFVAVHELSGAFSQQLRQAEIEPHFADADVLDGRRSAAIGKSRARW